jgi:hypothetical protein
LQSASLSQPQFGPASHSPSLTPLGQQISVPSHSASSGVQTPFWQVVQPSQTMPHPPQLLLSSLRSVQTLPAVLGPQQTVSPSQQRSGLSPAPGQKSAAGQQKSAPTDPPVQTVAQHPSTMQQTSLNRQHSGPDVVSQIRLVGGSSPGRLLVAQHSSSP